MNTNPSKSITDEQIFNAANAHHITTQKTAWKQNSA